MVHIYNIYKAYISPALYRRLCLIFACAITQYAQFIDLQIDGLVT
jgi:hypothetical protein